MGKTIGLLRPLRKSRFHLRAATGACRSFPFSGGAHAVGGQRCSPNTENGSFRGGLLPRGGPRPSASIWESDMNFAASRTLASTLCASGLFLALALTIGTARAQDKTYVMKMTAPTLNASPELRGRYRTGVQRPHQSRGLSGKPTRLDPAADRRYALQRWSCPTHAFD
jgi:hypothetical protein